MTETKQLTIAWHARNGGASEGWNHPLWGYGTAWNRPDVYAEVSRMLERVCVDMIVLSDRVDTTADVAAGAVARLEPTTLAAIMIEATRAIGIAPALSTEFYRPFMAARLISTLDHLSRGRIGWTLQPLISEAAIRSIGQELPIPASRTDRLRRAEEFTEVCRRLWASWGPDSVVGDWTTATFADPSCVYDIDHVGEFYSSRGPLNTVALPQGQPVTVMVPTDADTLAMAARQAEVVILTVASAQSAGAEVAALRAAITAAGRDAAAVRILLSVSPVIAASDAGAATLAASLDEAYGPSSIGGLRHVGTPDAVTDAIETLVDSSGADGVAIDALWLPSYVSSLTTWFVTNLQRRGRFKAAYPAPMLRDSLGLPRVA